MHLFGRRLKTRFAVLKARAQDDKVYYGNSNNRIFRESISTETKNSSKRKENTKAPAVILFVDASLWTMLTMN